MAGASSNVFRDKVMRIKYGGSIRTIDLFSGCGGLSLGFKKAGFSILGAVEIDRAAAKSHAMNFFKNDPPELFELHSTPRDITQVDPDKLLQAIGLPNEADRAVDVVIGGPPCQAFARVGRAKLREVQEHPEAYRQDPRANLYIRYLSYVTYLKPIAILMENVPDVLNFGGQNIAQQICESLSKLGYVCGYTLLNAAFYGVPQMRERMFLIAYHNEVNAKVTFPNPTHWVALPKGYKDSRLVALKHLNRGESQTGLNSFYIDPPEALPALLPAVTALEALEDLPPITAHLADGERPRGARHFTEKVTYSKEPVMRSYGWLMRNWPFYEERNGIYDHITRSLPRDYPIFAKMKPGDQYPEAYAIAWSLFKERIEDLRLCGEDIAEDSPKYKEILNSIVPPYDTETFPNKWRKLEPNKPVRTLMAHLGKDCYSHIHYDSSQARTISVREAARLQSFPDGFVFEGPMNSAFRQIGNAVPPLLAAAIANNMLSGIQKEDCQSNDSAENPNSSKSTPLEVAL